MPATRVEIVDSVGSIFVGDPITRDELLYAAVRVGARPAVLKALRLLPERRQFKHVRELWTELPDIPIGFESRSTDRGPRP